ncbi:MAG: hypothetical protein DWQ35_15350 [Planctomycetota bacterium]|nr:MAG: hypothetical protein DWQ35_15350 [Planctomycetota bacterium]
MKLGVLRKDSHRKDLVTWARLLGRIGTRFPNTKSEKIVFPAGREELPEFVGRRVQSRRLRAAPGATRPCSMQRTPRPSIAGLKSSCFVAGDSVKSSRAAAEGVLGLGPKMWAILVLALMTCLFAVSHSAAQEAPESVFVEPDRELRQRLDIAGDLLERGRHSEAIQVLVSVLQSPEDYLFSRRQPRRTAPNGTGGNADRPAGNAPRRGFQPVPARSRRRTTLRAARQLISLKREARRLLGQLPDEARRAYELQYGESAARRLEAAVVARDKSAIAEVARLFPHTQAGQESLILLGYDQVNRGHYLGAALSFGEARDSVAAAPFEPMLSLMLWSCWQRSNRAERAGAIEREMLAKYPEAELEFGGTSYRLFEEQQLNPQLVAALGSEVPREPLDAIDWRLAGGDAARNASSDGGRPLVTRPRWRQRLSYDAAAVKALTTARREFSERLTAAIPAAQAIAVRDMILLRSPTSLVAVDFKSGKRLWSISPTQLDVPQNRGDVAGIPAGVDLRRRVWLDRTFGTLSSDGTTVFAVESLGGVEDDLAGQPRIDPRFARARFGTDISQLAAMQNELVAYDVARSEGKRVWAVGGPHGVEPELEDAYFLGVPLPLEGRLYTLIEQEGEVRLVALGHDGRLLWKQSLALIPEGGSFALDRRFRGLSPSAAENILVCPTGVGALVAIDLTTRDLLWGYSYSPRTSQEEYEQAVPMLRPWNARQVSRGWLTSVGETSADDSVTIAAGAVLATPSDGRGLHLVDLATGKRRVVIRAGDSGVELYVGAVYQRHAFLVGDKDVTVVNLDRGSSERVAGSAFAKKAVPSGRGFRVADRYYLPLARPFRGELMVLDLAARKVVEHIEMDGPTVPGNLICYQGQIVSVGSEFVEMYEELEQVRRRYESQLAADPEDPWALTDKAAATIEIGKGASPEEAVSLLRRARSRYQKLNAELADSDPERGRLVAGQLVVRKLLFESLLAMMQGNFVKHRDLIDEIEPLIVARDERVDYLRVVSEGHDRNNELDKALAAYLELIDHVGTGEGLQRLSVAHSVRTSNWIRARLSTLYGRLDPAQRARYDDLVSQEYEVLEDARAAAPLRAFLDIHGGHSVSREVEQQLVERFSQQLSPSERVALLSSLVEQGPPDSRGGYVAQLASIYQRAGRPVEAAYYYRRLREEWADAKVLADKTGKQLVDALPAKSPTRLQFATAADWPFGTVTYSRSARQPRQRGPVANVQLLQRSAVHPEDLKLQLHPGNYPLRLSAIDGRGKELWSLTMQELLQQREAVIQPSVRLVDNRMYLCAESELMALDLLKSTTQSDRMLWRTGKHFDVLEAERLGQVNNNASDARPDFRPSPWHDNGQRHVNRRGEPRRALGPVTQGGVTYLRGGDLVSLDALSGETVWIRHDLVAPELANFVEIFGDDEALVLAPRGVVAQNRALFPQFAESRAMILRPLDGEILLETVELPAPERQWAYRGRYILTWLSDGGDEGTKNKDRIALFDPLKQAYLWQHPVERGAKGARVGHDQVAILEPNQGRFRVFDIDHGKVVLEQQLASEPDLRGLYVLRDRHRYLVLANRNMQGDALPPKRFGYQQPVDVTQFTGRVYAISRDDGQLLWPVPVTLKDLWIPLSQPSELPALVCFESDVNRNDSLASFLFLEKVTGAWAAPPSVLGQLRLSDVQVEADAAPFTIRVRFWDENGNENHVAAKFTAGARPPQPPVQMAHFKEKSKLGRFFEKFNPFGNNESE